ncbi:MAG: type 1 glutamine amidotransferase [Anaerolineae bacterium]|nr:type 1 glutamine amidotransferase [Anaerolineae bacterium]
MAGKLAGKTIAIIAAHEFEDVELLYPILRLSEEGATVWAVPVDAGLHTSPYLPGKPVTGRFGHTIPIAVMEPGKRYHVKTIEDLSPDNVDALLFPGGYSPDALRLHQPTLDLVRACYAAGKLVTAICHGPWVLVSAGIMKGRRSTGYVAVRDDVTNAGAEWVDAPAVVDGNVITGRVPDDLPEFCGAIIDALSKLD